MNFRTRMRLWIWGCEFHSNPNSTRMLQLKNLNLFFEWTAFKYMVKWLGALVNSLMLKARWKTLFLSSLIKNNVFSWYNSQSKRNLQNFNLFWRLVFAVPGATLIHIHLYELIIYMRYVNFWTCQCNGVLGIFM